MIIWLYNDSYIVNHPDIDKKNAGMFWENRLSSTCFVWCPMLSFLEGKVFNAGFIIVSGIVYPC
jgi:hypothetical protein